LDECGYEYEGCLCNPHYYFRKLNDPPDDRFPELKEMEGVNGYFYAIVLSPKYYKEGEIPLPTHAVVIDKHCNIVHDPNLNYKNLDKYPLSDEIGYNGIIDVFMINKKEEL
jgi:hypothetical protein